MLPPKRSEIAATILWWALAWEYDESLSARDRVQLARTVAAWRWWLGLGYGR